jgi:hypothetical protein
MAKVGRNQPMVDDDSEQLDPLSNRIVDHD